MRRLVLACLAFGAATAHGAYPLITEDTDTQGRGGWQLEGLSEHETERFTGARSVTDTLVLNYGLTEGSDLQVVVPWHRNGGSGIGDPELHLKWRFLERGPFSMGVKPGVSLPAGDAQEGRGTGKATWSVALLAAYDSGPLGVHADAWVLRNRNTIGERESIYHLSAGVLYQLGSLRLVADMTRETAPDPSVDQAAYYNVVGVIWSVRRDFGVGAGWKQGRGGASVEDAWLLGAGVRW